MKILLTKPVNRSQSIVIPNLGLGYLATALRKDKHEVTILDCVFKKYNLNDFKTYLRENNDFDVIGFQVFSCDLNTTRESIKIVRELPKKSVVVVGGPHPSGAPEHAFNYFFGLTDYLFIGEAEIGLPKLLKYLEGNNLNLKDIPGLVFKENGLPKINNKYFHEDIDEFGMVAWDLINPRMYPPFPHGIFVKEFPSAPIMTSRGCPFLCTFCAASTITGKKIRFRSIDRVMEEIQILVKCYGVKEIHIEDDNFAFNRQYVLEFCKKLIDNRPNISWSCPNGLRIDSLDFELLNTMKRAGCYSIALGIESGSGRILKHMKKDISENKIKEITGICQKVGIKVTGFFILGYPSENIKDIDKTIKFSRGLDLDRACFANFFPLPGTTISKEFEKSEETNNIIWDEYSLNKFTFNHHPYISKTKLRYLQKKATLNFYLRPKILINILKEIKSWRHFCYILKRIKEIFL